MLGGVTAAEAKSSKSAKYDLVIVGAGCGGLVCAIHAAELGLKPLLLEKMPMPAGNAIYAAGFLLGLNTSFQKAKNVPADTAEAFYDDMMKVSQQKAVPALTHTVITTARVFSNGSTASAASTSWPATNWCGRSYTAPTSSPAN